ncbi:CCA tRNA nucleotidyltransferase [Desulfonatronovibrio hydrogenovorans]|uniref:CCA tRNA nucleotidyltransferase n=1 Tax=Desulfonatronovibrio hydrogenovorans TaxID=53245 RepID=UPI00068A7AEF|nr:CCA tRNA nucleotidyltransferase [Desulfonatronovibrio hydrogenovorans]
MLRKALELIQTIHKSGYAALMVGGAVRDSVMARPIKDIDLATTMPVAELARHFPVSSMGRGRDFGLVSLKFQGQRFEVAQFRVSKILGGDPRTWKTKGSELFKMDALHRDFTINALAMDPAGQVLDPLSGLEDIKTKVIRTVTDPESVFKADPLRLLRAVRFSVQLGFSIDQKAFETIHRLARLILDVASERIGREIIILSSLSGPDFARSLSLMDRTGLLVHVLPEIHALKGLPHDPKHHPEGDVFEHTLAALKASPGQDATLNMAVLFHDAGKACCLEIKGSSPAYPGHGQAGIELIRAAGRRLHLAGDMISSMCFVAAGHMQAARLDEMRPSRIYRIMDHDCWPLLKKVVQLDLRARSANRAGLLKEKFHRAEKKVEAWINREQGKMSPVITGRQVLEHTGLAPGPMVGRVIRMTTQWALDHGVTDQSRILGQALEIAVRLSQTADKNGNSS